MHQVCYTQFDTKQSDYPLDRDIHNKLIGEHFIKTIAAREEQSFKLSDGRTMGFAEYGNLQGRPAFFLHGAPGSQYDGIGLIAIAKKLNLHIVCPDRPGHGLSSFQHNRKLIDYPKDISQLAKHIGTAQYNVFGQSGGGPYAVACAYGSPKTKSST